MNFSEYITKALQEDLGDGDHSALSCIPSTAQGKVKLLVKEEGILAGIEQAKEVFRQVDPNIQLDFFMKDGDTMKPGDIAFKAKGSRISLLSAERLALNIMQRMSGVATLTERYVRSCHGTKAKVLDTRKTTPNFRIFEKEAVRIGGGVNHRMGLYDMIMIKDNHIDFAGGIEQALNRVEEYLKLKEKQLKVEIEARDIKEVEEILQVGKGHRIMLDNFNYEDTRTAVELIGNSFETESSGGITLETIREYALCGVDYISVGALTHSYVGVDMSLKADI